MSELKFNPEFQKESSDEQLAAILKSKGFEDTEAKKLLVEWTIRREQEAEKSPDPDARINFERRRARLYYDAGNEEAAFEAFSDVYEIAWNEHKDELAKEIKEEVSSKFPGNKSK